MGCLKILRNQSLSANIFIKIKYYPVPTIQYNTIEGLVGPKIGYGLCQPEEAHSHPVCEGFLVQFEF